jgi:hypothetical protein
MRYLVGFVVVVALAASPLNVSAQDAEESASSEPNLEEPMSSSAPKAKVPDIATLSQRAIEHYEIQSAQSQRRRRRAGTGRKVGIAVGVILGATLVGLAIGGAVAMSNWEF